MKLFKLAVALCIIAPLSIASVALVMFTNGHWLAMVIAAIITSLSLVSGIDLANKLARKKRLEYIHYYYLPEIVIKKFMAENKGINLGQLEMITVALKQFFMAFALCKDGGKKPKDGFVMPSRIVDELWHHFMLDSANYAKFCKQAYGEMFHHKPGMDTEGNRRLHLIETFPQSVNDTYEYIKQLENYGEYRELDYISILFAIDAYLDIKNGYHYDKEIVKNIYKSESSSMRLSKNERPKLTKESKKSSDSTSSCGGFYMGLDAKPSSASTNFNNSVVATSSVASCDSPSSGNISGGGNFSGGGSTVSSCSSGSTASSCSSGCGGGGGGGGD